jgi:hypothetical protein
MGHPGAKIAFRWPRNGPAQIFCEIDRPILISQGARDIETCDSYIEFLNTSGVLSR